MIGRACFVSPSVTPANPSGLKTRQLGFKWVLHRPVEIATQSGHSFQRMESGSGLLMSTARVNRMAQTGNCQYYDLNINNGRK